MKRATSVEDAIRTRRSVRAFLPTPIDRATVEGLLALSSRAPSGTNIQPWKVRVVAGPVRDQLCKAILDALDRDGQAAHHREWNYYPVNWREPYLGRRRKLGWDLYGLLGIGKGEREKTRAQHARNFVFFDAPAALVFTIDRDFEKGSWLDYGMFLQSVMLAARGMGLDTCPQAAIASAHEILRRHLGIPPLEVVICGMSLGYAREAVENTLVTVREPVSTFAEFRHFDVP